MIPITAKLAEQLCLKTFLIDQQRDDHLVIVFLTNCVIHPYLAVGCRDPILAVHNRIVIAVQGSDKSIEGVFDRQLRLQTLESGALGNAFPLLKVDGVAEPPVACFQIFHPKLGRGVIHIELQVFVFHHQRHIGRRIGG